MIGLRAVSKSFAAAACAVAASFVLAACAAGQAAGDQRPAVSDADIVEAKGWLQEFMMADPVLASISACAHLRDSVEAFNERLTGVGFNKADVWRGSETGFLEAPPFELYRSNSIRLVASANRVDGRAVCALRFEGRLGPAIWEERRRWFRDQPVWGDGRDDPPAADANRFVKSGPDEEVALLFMERTRRDPFTLLIEFRSPTVAAPAAALSDPDLLSRLIAVCAQRASGTPLADAVRSTGLNLDSSFDPQGARPEQLWAEMDGFSAEVVASPGLVRSASCTIRLRGDGVGEAWATALARVRADTRWSALESDPIIGPGDVGFILPTDATGRATRLSFEADGRTLRLYHAPFPTPKRADSPIFMPPP